MVHRATISSAIESLWLLLARTTQSRLLRRAIGELLRERYVLDNRPRAASDQRLLAARVRSAETMVLCSNMVTVMGPTPPGTGVM